MWLPWEVVSPETSKGFLRVPTGIPYGTTGCNLSWTVLLAYLAGRDSKDVVSRFVFINQKRY